LMNHQIGTLTDQVWLEPKRFSIQTPSPIRIGTVVLTELVYHWLPVVNL
jgi:hypothetical protein